MTSEEEQHPLLDANRTTHIDEIRGKRQSNRARGQKRNRASDKPESGGPSKNATKRHALDERAGILTIIENHVAKDGVSLKAAAEAAGISSQTYYQWKRARKSASPAAVVSDPDLTPTKGTSLATPSSELADLVELEKENQRLRQLLAEKLRAENAELRRRLELE